MSANPPTQLWVLIVEDEKDLARMLAEKLDRAGVRSQTCSRVNEALTRIKNQKYGCIILDLHLEQESGERIVEILRGDKKICNHDTPILLTSGFVEERILRRIGLQVAGVFVKPFDTELLIAKVQQLLDGRPDPKKPS